MRVTDPSYISQQMFDVILREKLIENTDDDSVGQQARRLIQLFRGSSGRLQVMSDVAGARDRAYGPKWVGHKDELMIEIAFAMGLQCGYELGINCPPTTI